MDKSLKRMLAYLGIGLLLLLVLTVINQVYQISVTASTIHPAFGQIVTILLTAVFLVLFLVPLFGFLRLRKPLVMPDESDATAYAAYLAEVKQRLRGNRILEAEGFSFDESKELRSQIEDALAVLDKESIKVMNETSSQVFLTTAISQNGVLDGLFVLFNLSRIVWTISHIYNQRPSLREIFYLYTNVAVTVLMAREIEDLILVEEQLEPLIDSLIGSTVSQMVPGATAVTNLIVSSVIEGAINAFLTLRVAAMAKRYSVSLTKVDRRLVKRYAALEAIGLFRTIVQQNSVTVVKAFALASKRATIDRTVDRVRTGASRTGELLKNWFRRPGDGGPGEE